ncbi:aminotransferase class IV [Alphaproteobacteria bacterium]|nr:aminotransferase class IV [Alphaproteobacteria bacterium]
MTNIVFINGEYLPDTQAKLSIFDRGLLFADAVYEGFGILDSQIVDFEYHIDRLNSSLAKLNIPSPMDRDELLVMLMHLITVNEAEVGFLYLHITRGEGDRNYIYNDSYVPNLFAFIQKEKFTAADAPKLLSVHSVPDLRWARRDIKTTNLLGQVMAKQAAHEYGADEALMVDDDGFVTEAGSSSFFFIKDRVMYVRPVTNAILHGITRQTMLRVAAEHQITIREEYYTLEQAKDADEAFMTASSLYVAPVVAIDDTVIGNGEAGTITMLMRDAYIAKAREEFPKLPDPE